MSTEINSKGEKMLVVAETTLSIIVNYGLPGMTFSRVARLAKVSRAWLYKYIGKTKEDLVNFSTDIVGKEFAQLDVLPKALDAKGWIDGRVEALAKMLDDSIVHPWIVPIYYRYRGTQHPLGKRVSEIERTYLNKEVHELVRIFKIDKEQARVIAELLISFRLGLAYRWNWAELNQRIDREQALILMPGWLVATCLPPKK